MERTFYGAIDLHSNNNYAVISDCEDRVVKRKRLPNNLEAVDRFFEKYKRDISDIVIESTYNGYWLMDGLEEKGYGVKLANPAKMQPYSGLKHTDDEDDARWLNQMNRLGILPEGYIYPKEMRPMRDLLRKRLSLVQMRTQLINSLKHQFLSWKAMDVSKSEIQRMEAGAIDEVFEPQALRQSAHSFVELIGALNQKIKAMESMIHLKLKEDGMVKRLSMLEGIGDMISWTIRLEVGEIGRFTDVGHYLSYCGLVDSRRMSNERKKGEGNVKNRNKYLRWAYAEAVIGALRSARIKKYYERLKKRKHRIKAMAIVASKIARVSFMLMKDPEFVYDPGKLFV